MTMTMTRCFLNPWAQTSGRHVRRDDNSVDAKRHRRAFAAVAKSCCCWQQYGNSTHPRLVPRYRLVHSGESAGCVLASSGIRHSKRSRRNHFRAPQQLKKTFSSLFQCPRRFVLWCSIVTTRERARERHAKKQGVPCQCHVGTISVFSLLSSFEIVLSWKPAKAMKRFEFEMVSKFKNVDGSFPFVALRS
jgi:hypothetical protein